MIIEVLRGGFVESSHQVEACVQISTGETLFKTGEDFQFFPRSAVKPLQSQILLETGSYDSLGLDLRHLALASASHTGEKIHTDLVRAWLSKLGLNISSLNCGAHRPFDLDTLVDIKRDHQEPTALHNNCSGKHTGFLSVCAHMKLPFADYHLADHPLQIKVKELLQNRLEQNLSDYGIDGCSIPAYRMGFQAVARAFAKMAEEISENANTYSLPVFQAFTQHPYLTSGRDEYCMKLMEKNPGQILTKEGAEGVLIAVIPAKKMAIVVKAIDGTERASQNALDHLLEKFANLKPVSNKEIFNWAGREVGQVRVCV